MAVILKNGAVCGDIFRLVLKTDGAGRAGQFLEVHPNDGALLLPRPLSIYDADPVRGETALVYRAAGAGTRQFAGMRPGDALRITGPLGNGFLAEPGDAVLIGGGLGIAPLHFLLKTLRAAQPARRISVYLGYSGDVFLAEEYRALADVCQTEAGGYITDRVDFSCDAVYYACGPAPMMAAAAKQAAAFGKKLYVSLESRMACGVGACLGCSIKTRSGSRRVCKDGPVFEASEVYDG